MKPGAVTSQLVLVLSASLAVSIAVGLSVESRADDKDGVPPGAKMLPPIVARGQCLECPVPKLPEAVLPKGRTAWAMVKICVDTAGQVVSTKMVKAISPGADAEIDKALRKWKYRPYLIQGRPVPFCYIQRLDFA